jgi:hypothetical protein
VAARIGWVDGSTTAPEPMRAWIGPFTSQTFAFIPATSYSCLSQQTMNVPRSHSSHYTIRWWPMAPRVAGAGMEGIRGVACDEDGGMRHAGPTATDPFPP